MGLSPFLIFFPINPRGPAPAFLARALGRIHTYLLLRQVRPSMEVLGFAAMVVRSLLLSITFHIFYRTVA
jgi:hypothetical protein